jgi:hypothetical protein
MIAPARTAIPVAQVKGTVAQVGIYIPVPVTPSVPADGAAGTGISPRPHKVVVRPDASATDDTHCHPDTREAAEMAEIARILAAAECAVTSPDALTDPAEGMLQGRRPC